MEMLNKILKIFFLLNLILISAKTFAVDYPAKTDPMFINTRSLSIPKNGSYPKLLGVFESENNNMVILQGKEGPHSYKTTASVDVFEREYTGSLYNNSKIYQLNGSSDFGFTISIDPIYEDSDGYKSFPGGYIQRENLNNTWLYSKNQNHPSQFNAIKIGAKIKIAIIALQKPTSGTVTIESQTIAKLDFLAERGAIGNSFGKVNININSITINPSPNTCKITPSDTHIINMKPVNINDFPSVGSEVDGGGNTTITLACSEGATSVKVGMTDITERNNTSNQLKLDPKSTALGFAVTLYNNNGNIITYNPDPKTGNNTWELSPSTSSSNSVNYNVPIKAKYYRTGSIISPGTIVANAAITFIYE